MTPEEVAAHNAKQRQLAGVSGGGYIRQDAPSIISTQGGPSAAPAQVNRLGAQAQLQAQPQRAYTAPPERSFSDDQQYLRDTTAGMYGKGQPISSDMRDYYSGRYSDMGMDFNKQFPTQPTQPALGTPVQTVPRPTSRRDTVVRADEPRPMTGGWQQ